MRYLFALLLVVLPFGFFDGGKGEAANVQISVTDQTYTCNTAVAPNTELTLDYTYNFPGRGLNINRLCTGDGDVGTCDLVLDIKGDGLTYGVQDDAIRIMNYQSATSQGLTICGHADCGNRQGTTFHQDGMQQLGGNGITFKDFTIGDYDGQQATCQGAGGSIFYSLPGVDIDVLGGKFITCNWGLHASGDTSPGSEVRDASFRSGHAATDPVCAPYFSSPACHISPDWGGESSNLTCDNYPFDDPPPPPPPPPPPDTEPPPVPSIIQAPDNPTNEDFAVFEFEDAEAGVSFECSLDASAFVSCDSPESYVDLADGSHEFEVLAKDAAQNASAPASFSWAIDTTPPPVPSINSGPSGKVMYSGNSTATFTFSDSESGVSFLCSLDGAAFTACSSPKVYSGITVGVHSFAVKAADALGNESAPATRSWQRCPVGPFPC